MTTIIILKSMSLVVACALYYGLFLSLLVRVTLDWSPKTGPLSLCSISDAQSVVRLAGAGISQVGFCIFLVAALHISSTKLIGATWKAHWILYGLVLGVSEMAFATAVCGISIRLLVVRDTQGRFGGMTNWIAVSRAGWMRYFLDTWRVLPPWLAIALSVLYITGEEVVFRGIAIQVLWSFGPMIAVFISTLMFACVQVFRMPSWRSALFPVIGASIVGCVHGILYVANGALVPLVIAHVIFFVAAVL